MAEKKLSEHQGYKKALEIDPSCSVKRTKMLPFKNQADLKLVIDAMRKAGFPE